MLRLCEHDEGELDLEEVLNEILIGDLGTLCLWQLGLSILPMLEFCPLKIEKILPPPLKPPSFGFIVSSKRRFAPEIRRVTGKGISGASTRLGSINLSRYYISTSFATKGR